MSEQTIERLRKQAEEESKQAPKQIDIEGGEHEIEAKEPPATREYVVLRLDGAAWTIVGTVEASSTEGAIKSTSGLANDRTYVAVPVRNWKPITPQVETTTRVRFVPA